MSIQTHNNDSGSGRLAGRVVFSTLYRESLDYLPVYVAQFLRCVDDGPLLINMPGDLYDKATRLPDVDRLQSGKRVRFVRAHAYRHAFGSGLLLAHLFNFSLARQVWEFDYFCTLASNAVFFRRFDPLECIQVILREWKVPTVPVTTDDRSGNWPKILGSRPLLAYMAEQGFEKFCCNQIEGLFASVRNWERVASRQKLFEEIEAAFNDDRTRFPVEEVLPGTIMANEGDGAFTHLCWNHLERVPSGGKVRFDDLLALPNRRYSAQTFAVKWVDRDARSPVTHALTDPVMNERLRQVAAAVHLTSPVELIACHHLFEAAASALRKRFNAVPLIVPPAGRTEARFQYDGPIDRRSFPLWPDDNSPEFLFLEQYDAVTARFAIQLAGNSVAITWQGGELAALPVDARRHRRLAYLYLPLPAVTLAAETCLELTVIRKAATSNDDRKSGNSSTTDAPDNPAVLEALAFNNRYGRLVTHVSGRYEAITFDHRSDGEENNDARFYFHLGQNMSGDGNQATHIGLPVVAGDDVTFCLSAWVVRRDDRESH